MKVKEALYKEQEKQYALEFEYKQWLYCKTQTANNHNYNPTYQGA